ncbi:cytochrome c biogenesis protein CcdA [Lacrimispora sp.]|uniref:cytochrome c biogenesis CcdA family protein n=1 Tax=Lacrimispora sp. TaxID=2719234 RepID=UPI0029E66F7C|nr:cytochrome c-type biosis protein [Lacrimispora sp.]
MVHNWLDSLSMAIQNGVFIAPLLALIAGIATSVSPCALANIPLVIGLTNNDSRDIKHTFRLSFAFVLGTTVTFVALGLVASLLGQSFNSESKVWSIVLGALMLLMALQILDVLSIIPSHHIAETSKRTGLKGVFIAGMVGGIFSSACAMPILLVLVGVAARSGSIPWGALLLIMFSVGHSALTLLAGVSTNFVQKVGSSTYARTAKRINTAMGIVLLVISLCMLFLLI